MVYLDHDELDSVFDRRWLWSTKGPALAWYRREDHFGDHAIPLERAVRDRVEAEIGRRPRGPVRTLTQLRYAGYIQNPVSFHYCFDSCDARVEAIVAEVTNTPWGETHCYVLDPALGEGYSVPAAKSFHVSPFMDMAMTYRWATPTPTDSLKLAVGLQGSLGERIFDADLRMARREITSASLARVLVRYPAMTAQVVAGIYWQALRLFLKGAKFHPHPRHREVKLEAQT